MEAIAPFIIPRKMIIFAWNLAHILFTHIRNNIIFDNVSKKVSKNVNFFPKH